MRCPDLDAWIRARWDATALNTHRDDDSLIALAAPYTVPCIDGMFQELYYWDTFYTCEGLIAHGRLDLARGNADCLLGLVDRFGFVPNGNRTWYLSRSQPPHLALLVDRVHAAGAGDGWLAAALPRVERELAFWRTLRDTPCGLAAYGSHGSDAEALSCLEAIEQTRFRVSAAPADRVRTAHDLIASCESGWDFTPRFGYSCRDLCPVDLNALLAASEDLVGIWRARLGLPGAEAWRRAAARRRSLLDDLCWDPDLATWLDWDMATSRRRPQPSAAAGYALWLGTVDPAKAQAWVARALPRLLMAGGVTTCEPGPRTQVWQWDHPNAWPPLQYAVVHGLHRHGFTIEARTVAEAWGRAVLGGWRSTGQLWEKPNAVTGGNDVVDEYPMPAMLGWTAGVWAHFRERGWITDPG